MAAPTAVRRTSRPRPGAVARLASHLPPRLASRFPGPAAPPVPTGTRTPRIAIIGSGFGGLGLAARLRQAGIETFTIFEKAEDLGGTWRDNTYPGAACDVPSHLYSLSFAPKLDWSRRFPEQAEIHDYLHDVADGFGLGPHIRFGVEVVSATFDDEAGEAPWTIEFADGGVDRFDIVISATGQLNRPHTPGIEGLDQFDGDAFHSARWRHDIDLADRDVAVVGIGASAIQFVPEVAKQARSVTLFQRSVNYVAPKPDAPFSERTRLAFELIPGLARLYRASIWARFEARWLWFRKGSRSARLGEKLYRDRVSALVSEELPAQAILPDHSIGCRRILISNDWFPTLLRPNVTVVTDPVESVDATGIRTPTGHHGADTIIFGTGFESTGFLAPMEVRGRGGRDLHEGWARGGIEAHLGIAVAGFPNLFLLYGPNTNLGHNSIVFMIERQVGYVLSCIRRMIEEDLVSLEVRPDAQAESNRRLVEELADTVWVEDCSSWYKDASGRITNNWSGPTYRYWARTAIPRPSDFVARPRL